MHERFFASKGKSKTSISSTHFSLTPQNADIKRTTYTDLWQGHASRNLVLTSYPNSVPECYLRQFFSRQGADKFRVNNVISCPASHIYYSTKHNDGVEDYLDQTDNG